MLCIKRSISTARSRFLREELIAKREDSSPSAVSETQIRASGDGEGGGGAGLWANMLPELLSMIIRKVDDSDTTWPQRRNVVSCACVCKTWREVAKEVVLSSPRISSGFITFPSCLKQPGPREFPQQCLIIRNKKTGTFCLYLALSNNFTDMGKFLLSARRYRRGAYTDYVISLDADDISQRSISYVGKLSLDLFGTNFSIFDSQPPHIGAKPSCSRTTRRFSSNQISPQVAAGNFEVGQVSYKFNLLKSRGPRRMTCAMKSPVALSVDDKHAEKKESKSLFSSFTILQNKTPRWHEHLQCWCLNFHGRVTVASVKNFQLVATVDPTQPESKGDEDTVILQFGKVGDDIFTMDYRQPLSAFQAFAICLSSFGTKLA